MSKLESINQKSRISDELRRSIIIAINNGIATKKVSALYNVKLSTVYNINTIYKKMSLWSITCHCDLLQPLKMS